MSRDFTRDYVYIDSLASKKLFLDFWKLPYSTNANLESVVSIVNGKGLEEEFNNAVVILEGNGEPQLYHLDGGIYIFTKIKRFKDFPSHLKVTTPIFDEHEKVVSFILMDSEKRVIYLPFTLDEVFEGFHREKYLTGRKTFLPKFLLTLYYSTKPLISQGNIARLRVSLAKMQGRRRFPRWPLESSLEDFKRLILNFLLSVSKTGKLPIIWFWPKGKESCLLLTHDVESGLQDNGGILRLISGERELGFKSSFNIVPFKYEIDRNVMHKVESYGCEIGVHGFSHDAKLFSSFRIFQERIKKINRVAKRWGADGFRSASTYRNPDWCYLMNFKYDASFFDTDPYEPQPGGCLSLFPYFIGEIVELPTTLPQDYTLFVLLKQEDIRIWREKVQKIKELNGMISLIAHPDEGYIGDKDKEKHYIEFLGFINGDSSTWNPLPKELAKWWRRRRDAEIISKGNELLVKNGLSEMCIKWAKIVNGELKIDESC